MKVILLKDIKKLGKKDQIIEVADGYGRNYLIPNKLAVAASDTGVKVLKQQQKEHQQELAEEAKAAEAVKAKLKGITLKFPVKVGENGRVFGSVSTKQVEEVLKKEHDITVDKRKFKPNGPITALGLNRISVTLFGDVVGEIQVHLVEEA